MRDEGFIEPIIPTAGDISHFIYPIRCNDNSALISQVWDKFLEALHLYTPCELSQLCVI